MFHMMIEYHVSSSKERHEEYLTCIRENIKNPLIDKIHIFLEPKANIPIDDPKIVYVEIQKIPHKDIKFSHTNKSYSIRSDQYRLRFSDCFKYARENLLGQNCILSNADIVFDDSLGVIDGVDLKNTMLCLTRWDHVSRRAGQGPRSRDIKGDGSLEFYDRADSQDSWIFTSPMSKKVEEETDFFFGIAGCDNLLAWLAHEAGMKLTNPAHQIITKHLHSVNYRTYDISARVFNSYGQFVKVYPTDDWTLSRVANYLIDKDGDYNESR